MEPGDKIVRTECVGIMKNFAINLNGPWPRALSARFSREKCPGDTDSVN